MIATLHLVYNAEKFSSMMMIGSNDTVVLFEDAIFYLPHNRTVLVYGPHIDSRGIKCDSEAIDTAQLVTLMSDHEKIITWK